MSCIVIIVIWPNPVSTSHVYFDLGQSKVTIKLSRDISVESVPVQLWSNSMIGKQNRVVTAMCDGHSHGCCLMPRSPIHQQWETNIRFHWCTTTTKIADHSQFELHKEQVIGIKCGIGKWSNSNHNHSKKFIKLLVQCYVKKSGERRTMAVSPLYLLNGQTNDFHRSVMIICQTYKLMDIANLML